VSVLNLEIFLLKVFLSVELSPTISRVSSGESIPQHGNFPALKVDSHLDATSKHSCLAVGEVSLGDF